MDNATKKLWEQEFGNNEIAYDFVGREIRKGCYGQRGSKYGWDIDHIFPKSQGGTDDFVNLQITHMETNAERANKMTFWIDDTLYQVKRVSRLYDGDEVANYNYNGKKYCIIIVEQYSEEDEDGYCDDDEDDY
jgi:hypothetical protein